MQATTYRPTHLRSLLDSRGIRHGWVAKQIGVSKWLMSHYLAGRMAVPADRAERIASTLGVPLFFVFESLAGDDSSSPSDDQPSAA